MAEAGPSATLPIAGRERQVLARGWGRARSARAESGPSEPILNEADTETSETEETVSQDTDSSESTDDDAASSDANAEKGSEAEGGNDSSFDSDSASSSNSGADGDNAAESAPPRKRTKRASRV